MKRKSGRALICTAYDTSASGGLSTFVKLYAQGLREKGYDVTIVDERSISPLKRLLAFWLIRNPLYVVRKDWGMRAYFSLIKRMLGKEIAQSARDGKPSFIHAQDVLAANAAAGIGALKDAPIILNVHGDLTNMCLSDGVVTKGGSGERAAMQEETHAYDVADRIIAVDTRLRNHVEGFSHRTDIAIIKNFVDTDEFVPAPPAKALGLRKAEGINEGTFVLFCPRRLVKKNGTIFAAKAVARIAAQAKTRKDVKNGEDILLVIAGSGPEQATLEKLMKEKNLGNSIRMLGDVKHGEILKWYQLCDAVIIPSVTSEGVIEATSISALEGMACEKPVIASNIGGLAELITDGKTGLLVPEQDVKAIASCVLRAMDGTEERDRLGKAARLFVCKNHSIESQTTRYLKTILKKAHHA